VGFEVVERLAEQFGAAGSRERFESQVAECDIAGHRVLLQRPLTYMNLSGRAVRQLIDFYKLTPGDMLVVCDDLNLDPGRLRLRAEGSAGGQKGLHDIIQRLGTQSIARLRIGIGRPPERMDSADYVLQRFSPSERTELEPALVRASEGVVVWVRDGVDTAMNSINPRTPLGSPPPREPTGSGEPPRRTPPAET
jgi:PTH1 family peptidyl-tRNA hydrolase